MKWHCKVLVFSLILMTSWCTSHAQSTNKKLAYAFLNDGKYLQACEYFTEYLQHHPADKAIQMQLAIALYHTRRIKEATQYIDQLLATSGRVKQEEAFLYKAYLLHDAQEFSAAVKFYKKYLQLGKCSTEKRSRIKQRILNCATGIQLSYKSNAGSIQELPSLNTAFDEYLPVPSPNYDDLVYFSSNRLGNWDIFSATFSNNALESKNTVTSLTLNTPKAEQLLDFDASGSAMRFLQYDADGKARILTDSFRVTQSVLPEVQDFPILDTPLAVSDSSLFFVNDSVVLFASQTLGGYGGYDLYLSRKVGKQWAAPQNLGEAINSSSDELAPFLANDGLTLYFSSNDVRRSMGGFDLFKAKFSLDDEGWSSAQNLGLSINSTQDELCFRPSSNGRQAFFCSNNIRGQGGYDVYRAYLSNLLEEMNPMLRVPFWQVENYKQQQLASTLQKERNKKHGLSYRILLTTSPKLDRSILPTTYPDIKIHPSADGQQFLYFVGLYRRFYSVQQLQRDLIQAGWSEAAILPQVNGILLEKDEIAALSIRYPDLKVFLEHQ